MPNNRRRRFSVQNNISTNRVNHGSAGQNNCLHNSAQQKAVNEPSYSSTTIQTTSSIERFTKQPTNLVFEESVNSVNSRKLSTGTNDKNVSANSSMIKFYNILNKVTDSTHEKTDGTQNDTHKSRDRKSSRSVKRDKHIHRAHVRSPKRKIPVLVQRSDSLNRTIGTSPIGWEPLTISSDIEDDKTDILMEETNSSVGETSQHCSISRRSSHSLEDMCRICHGGEGLSQELGQLISACMCRGTVGRVHVKCLERWLTESGKSRCELCGTRYVTRRVHRYGVPKGLVMWVLSQNAKQLLVDSLGIMLMSPLAVLAAWLSGRTLAGLMTQDPHITPWPLASTFVLACMTLVCYYCWIVSAATRHALGWWVWYRSHYEVRLTIPEQEAY